MTIGLLAALSGLMFVGIDSSASKRSSQDSRSRFSHRLVLQACDLITSKVLDILAATTGISKLKGKAPYDVVSVAGVAVSR